MRNKESKFIVHIATDEKFIDAAYDIYEESFPGKNLFLILQNQGQDSIKYLSSSRKYFIIKTDREYCEKVENYTNDAKLVVFHGMNYFQALLVHKLDKLSKKYIWSVFGAEVYNNELIIKNVSLGEKTSREFVFSYKKLLKDKFRSIYYLIWKRKMMPKRIIKHSFLKMDMIGILYQEELDNYIRLNIVEPNAVHVKFTYYPLEIIIEENIEFVNGGNILLGNSASYTNNHLEAIEVLEKFGSGYQNIIMPLSYGNKDYANKIIELGSKKFGERFSPLTEFMPLREYQKLLQSCGIVIMNHSRQQAVGNVMNAIYLGSKVYLNERNTLFHYLKRIGCHIYSVDHDLNVENNEVFNLLTIQQMKHNRAIVSSELSLDRVVTELRDKLSPLL